MRDTLNTPVTWLALSVLAYEIGLRLNRKLRTPICNPLLVAAILMGAVLVLTGTPLADYNAGGGFLTLFLTPATVALAVPIYRQLEVLKKNLLPILAGALVGSIVSIGSVILLCRLFGLDDTLTHSLIPKSVTTPIGVQLSGMLGGLTPVTAIAIIITGLFGAVLLPAFLKLLRITDPVTVGIAIGTASHAVGTSRAIELGETEGAMSGLAIGVAGLMTAMLVSLGAAVL
ncbi:MAG: LrgB family protein [Butyricicoccus sp.]|nr:LrgB family protein [Butyricicoccus pullicaecorum]MCI6720330.1 LrgB family protein [Clostridiales bacterium]MDY5971552.1 LrgB family protein [Butyricicoccus sp.]